MSLLRVKKEKEKRGYLERIDIYNQMVRMYPESELSEINYDNVEDFLRLGLEGVPADSPFGRLRDKVLLAKRNLVRTKEWREYAGLYTCGVAIMGHLAPTFLPSHQPY